ncbi:hypothetical protein [Streptomyces herbicida]|uniref:hypothetical protein n=2 Tax=Streptomyces TaxID=1883 RepID=UPI00292E3F34|nr:hypothetical protein [Streptomyces sp. NEAU-HV9]
MDRVDHVETNPIRALESFVLSRFPAEETKSAEEESTAGELGYIPAALAAFHRPARLRPAIRRFHDPVLKQPQHPSGPLGDRLVFAVWSGAGMDWSIPWPLEEPGEGDPHAWTHCMPTARLDTLWTMLRPVPLGPFLPTYAAERFFVAPGLLTQVSSGEKEAVVSFGALHRGTLTPLLEHGFRWSRFDG